MGSVIHIVEVAALLFVAYQMAWFVGFGVRRSVSRLTKVPAIAVETPPVVKPESEAPVRAPVIAPIAAAPLAPASEAPTPVDKLIAHLEPAPVPAAPPVETDVAPPPVLTAIEADVSPPPVPLSADFLAELQSAMLEDAPDDTEPVAVDPKTSAAVTAAFEHAFELTPVPPEVSEAREIASDNAEPPESMPASNAEDQPGLFDVDTDPPEAAPEPPPTVAEVPVPPEAISASADAEGGETPAVAAAVTASPSEPEGDAHASEAPSPDAMPKPPMAPATEPGTLAANARIPATQPSNPPAQAAPIATAPATAPAMPASKPGEVWSGRSESAAPRRSNGNILRPPGAPRAPSLGPASARPATSPSSGEAVAVAREAVAAAAAKVQQVVAASSYEDSIEASDEDAEAAAMRAIESGWMRKAGPRKSKPDSPEGVPPSTPRKDT